MGARWHTGHLLRILAAPLLLGGVLTGLGSTAAAAATCQAWTGGQPANPNNIGSGDSLSAVAMLSACDVWTVGDRGSRTTLIEHWTGGSSWTVVPSPDPGSGFNSLTSIRGVSPTDIWAVGSYSNPDGSTIKGLILHWNGIRWLQSPSPNPGNFTQLTGVRAVSANDAWAVGTVATDHVSQTLILHWDGTRWTQSPSPSPGIGSIDLTGVTATSATDAWAVGDYVSESQNLTLLTLILHWDGKSWKQVPSPSPGPVGLTQLTSVDATSPTDAWAVGFFPDGTNNQNLILHWDGKIWTQTPSPNPADDDRLDSVAASSAGNAVAVGTGQAHVHGALPATLALRWDGTAWTPAPSIQEGGPGTENTLLGVATISPTEAWAVGFFGPTPTQTLAFHLK
jgi:hypothetical protein